MEYEPSEAKCNKKVQTRFEKRDFTSKCVVKEKDKRVITHRIQEENNGLGCNKCKAVYKNRKGPITLL